MISNSLNRFFMAFIALAFFFFFACSSDGEESGSMDGTWYMEEDDFTLEISGKNYLLKYEGENVTKGIVTYDDSNFEFIITYEWNWYNEIWRAVSASKKIFGKYARNGSISVFSEVYIDYGDGPESYSMFNGNWIKK